MIHQMGILKQEEVQYGYIPYKVHNPLAHLLVLCRLKNLYPYLISMNQDVLHIWIWVYYRAVSFPFSLAMIHHSNSIHQ